MTAPISLMADDIHVSYVVNAQVKLSMQTLIKTRFSGHERQSVHAVRGVSFSIYEGESVGVVGSNGSGKSTLLRALAGLLPPTSGHVYANSVPMLLGVASALRPPLSGMSNIEIGLLALGLNPEQVAELTPEVAEYTELGKAINRPLNTYSSGMRARLQFAIATSIRPRILLIDEALSVGDRHFKKKSYERISAMRGEAGTIVFVSHSAGEVERVCDRVIWLEAGEIVADGPAEEVMGEYSRS